MLSIFGLIGWKHETLPWHVGVNWSKDGLIVHLHEQSFARIFC